MFMPNDVYQFSSNRFRVLWSNRHVVFWINIDDESALPLAYEKSELENYMAKGDLLSIDDPYMSLAMSFPKAGSRSEDIQNRAWEVIKDFVVREPEIFQRDTRGPLVSDMLNNNDVTKQTLYRWLRRYWQFGKCKNALSGRYEKCGGAGKSRTPRDKKLGAPRRVTPGEGINVDEKIRALFRVTIEKSILNNKQYSFDYAYNLVLIAFGLKLPCSAKDLLNVPTERQFKYFYQKEYSPIDVTKAREGDINYQKDYRPVLGTSTAEVAGPGSRYQIDATIADVYLVSEKDRSKVIGRPTMYFVVDVFSRAIVGMYVGLENPSWVSAMEALANAMTNKVGYCSSFDINIDEDTWPAAGLPEAIIGDRGEMLGRHVEVLSKAFNVDIENTPPYRPDWKGIVERYFRTIQTKMKPFVEGYVTGKTIGKKRHGDDYRQDGIHTLREFTQMIIRIVLYYNNHNSISTYDPDEDIPPTLPHVPVDLWNWGIEYRTGRLRRPDERLVKVNLMPHTEATISEHGLKLFGCLYTCREALDWGWFEGNYKGPKKVTVAYDLYSANSIFLRPDDSYDNYIEATLTQRSRAYADLTIWEVWELNSIKAKTAATSRLKERAGSVNLVADLEAINRRSKQQQPDVTDMSKSEKVKHISDNKRQERQHEREKKQGESLAQEASAPGENVTYLKDKQESRKSFRLPTSLKDLLNMEQDDD
jgi:hypothetical protein